MTEAKDQTNVGTPVKTALQVAREAAKLSTAELAKKAGVAEVLIKRGENGLRIFKDTAKKLAVALEVPVDKLFNYMVPVVEKKAPAKPAEGKEKTLSAPPDEEVPMQSKSAPAETTKPAEDVTNS